MGNALKEERKEEEEEVINNSSSIFKETLEERLSRSPMHLKTLSEKQRNDESLVFSAVTSYGGSFVFASKELRSNRDFVLRLIKGSKCLSKCSEILLHSSVDIKRDREIVLEVLRIDINSNVAHNLIQNVENYSSDRELVLAAVRSNGLVLRIACDSLRDDKEVVLEAVKNDITSLKHASRRLQDDNEVIDCALRDFRDKRLLLMEFWSDEFFVVRMMRNRGWHLSNFHPSMMKNVDIVLEALYTGCVSLIELVKDRRLRPLLDNERFVSEIIRMYDFPLSEVGWDLLNERSFVFEQVKNDYRNIRIFYYKLLKRHKFFNDYEIMVHCVERDGMMLMYAGKNLRDEKGFVLKAVRNNGLSLQYASKTLRNDEQVVITAVRNTRDACEFIGKNILGSSSHLKTMKELDWDVERFLDDISFSHKQRLKLEPLDKEIVTNVISQPQFMSGVFKSTVSQNFEKDREMNHLRELKKKLKGLHFHDFELVQKLGSGGYGSTYLCYKRDSFYTGIFVMKLYNNSEVLSEARKLEFLRKDCIKIPYHENIVQILDFKDREEITAGKLPDYGEKDCRFFTLGRSKQYKVNNCAMILMRYHRSDLSKFIKRRASDDILPCLHSDEIIRILLCVIRGVDHLNQNFIVHRDLHCGNIFIDEKCARVWIGDFGCALDLRGSPDGFIIKKPFSQLLVVYSSDNALKRYGCKDSIAPEIRNVDLENVDSLDYQFSDIYSAGVIGEELLNLHESDAFIFFKKGRKLLRGLVENMKIEDPKKRIVYETALKEAEAISKFIVRERDDIRKKKEQEERKKRMEERKAEKRREKRYRDLIEKREAQEREEKEERLLEEIEEMTITGHNSELLRLGAKVLDVPFVEDLRSEFLSGGYSSFMMSPPSPMPSPGTPLSISSTDEYEFENNSPNSIDTSISHMESTAHIE